MSNKTYPVLLCFLWTLFGVSKIAFTYNIYLSSYIDILTIVNFLFVFMGAGIITFRLLSKPVSFNAQIFVFFVLLLLSLLNNSIFALIFNFLVWYSIAEIVPIKSFRFVYIINIGLLIGVFYISVKLNGDTYYFDLRYGDVKSFGFENANSFPQLLIIFYLIFSTKIRHLFMLFLVYLLVFIDDIYTKSFYVILVIYPCLLLLFKYYRCRYLYLLPVMLFLGSILFVYMYASNIPIAIKVDQIFSYRISFSNIILSSIPNLYYLFFGLSGGGDEQLPMDLSYMAIIFTFGLIPSLIIILMYTRTLKSLIIKYDYGILALCTTFLLYAFVENILISFILNPTFYYVFYYLNSKR
ncbi:TPA: hypothetical protein RY372_003486 [Escherichia albertii]|uniref:Wzy n=1 Tax=Escherichia albertii TaxID=208962 RepID=A0A288W573_ESCAL|nr:Wzy [Escherichia albertii]HEB1166420.1 hypothetical protein [Escherichia albertii]